MSRLLRILFCAFLALGLFAQSASAADITAAVNKMQTAYAGMQSFRADFTQQLLQRESGVVEKETASFSSRSPFSCAGKPPRPTQNFSW